MTSTTSPSSSTAHGRPLRTELLQRYVAAQAAKRPDARAVVLRDEGVTYGSLECESNRLARVLQTRCEPGDRVAILAPKGTASILVMHAALKAGCPYVPIDVASPPARVRRILDAASPRVVIVATEEHGVAAADGTTMPLEAALEEAEAMSGEPVEAVASAEDVAHVLFTSGSTGTPKGVPIRHRNVTRFIEWALRHFGMGPEDRVSGHSPHHFDLSTFDIYGAFAAGAELHVVPPELNLLPPALVAWIRDARLTQWFSVPSAMTLVAKFDAIEKGSLPDLRRVLWCGEVLPTAVLRYWMERVPQARFTNLYGPTEATIASSWYDVTTAPPSDRDPVPIGRACDGEELLVLDASLDPARPGEIGDLYIAGEGLSPGYWQDDETTAAQFIEDPRSPGSGARIYRTGDLAWVDREGLHWFVGRRDTQIKSRGHRIELGEIEAALAGVRALRESAVVGIETGGFEGTSICCAYVADDEATPARLRAQLREVLPSYMLPARWLRLPALPKNANGKIDRRRIAELFRAEIARAEMAAEA